MLHLLIQTISLGPIFYVRFLHCCLFYCTVVMNVIWFNSVFFVSVNIQLMIQQIVLRQNNLKQTHINWYKYPHRQYVASYTKHKFIIDGAIRNWISTIWIFISTADIRISQMRIIEIPHWSATVDHRIRRNTMYSLWQQRKSKWRMEHIGRWYNLLSFMCSSAVSMPHMQSNYIDPNRIRKLQRL